MQARIWGRRGLRSTATTKDGLWSFWVRGWVAEKHVGRIVSPSLVWGLLPSPSLSHVLRTRFRAIAVSHGDTVPAPASSERDAAVATAASAEVTFLNSWTRRELTRTPQPYLQSRRGCDRGKMSYHLIYLPWRRRINQHYLSPGETQCHPFLGFLIHLSSHSFLEQTLVDTASSSGHSVGSAPPWPPRDPHTHPPA